MNRAGRAVCRLVLRAYPASFRRRYGDELVRSVQDLRRHRGMSRWRIALLVVVDLVRTAPRLRMEAVGNQGVASVIIAAAVVLLAAVVGSPVLPIVILGGVGLLALGLRRRDRSGVPGPIPPGRWYRCIGAGLASFLVGCAALVIDGDDELSEAVWSIWMLSWALGAVLVVYGVLVGGAVLIARRSA